MQVGSVTSPGSLLTTVDAAGGTRFAALCDLPGGNRHSLIDACTPVNFTEPVLVPVLSFLNQTLQAGGSQPLTFQCPGGVEDLGLCCTTA